MVYNFTIYISYVSPAIYICKDIYFELVFHIGKDHSECSFPSQLWALTGYQDYTTLYSRGLSSCKAAFRNFGVCLEKKLNLFIHCNANHP